MGHPIKKYIPSLSNLVGNSLADKAEKWGNMIATVENDGSFLLSSRNDMYAIKVVVDERYHMVTMSQTALDRSCNMVSCGVVDIKFSPDTIQESVDDRIKYHLHNLTDLRLKFFNNGQTRAEKVRAAIANTKIEYDEERDIISYRDYVLTLVDWSTIPMFTIRLGSEHPQSTRLSVKEIVSIIDFIIDGTRTFGL